LLGTQTPIETPTPCPTQTQTTTSTGLTEKSRGKNHDGMLRLQLIKEHVAEKKKIHWPTKQTIEGQQREEDRGKGEARQGKVR